jgi:hypothetical protein
MPNTAAKNAMAELYGSVWADAALEGLPVPPGALAVEEPPPEVLVPGGPVAVGLPVVLVLLADPVLLPLAVLLADPEGAPAVGVPNNVTPLGIGPGGADAEAPCPTSPPMPCYSEVKSSTLERDNHKMVE